MNSVTFKYLLQEKAMFRSMARSFSTFWRSCSSRYLRHPRIANEIEEFQDFHSLVMFTDLEGQVSWRENPFTGNDRFVVYEDGGRPIDVQLATDWRPTCAVVRQIASQLVEALAYLFSKKVVHRKLELGSVVLNRASNDIKLISLGEAKYIEPLDYEQKISEFKREWQGVPAAAGAAVHHSHSSAPPPRNPTTDLSLDKAASTSCAHPSLRYVTTRSFIFLLCTVVNTMVLTSHPSASSLRRRLPSFMIGRAPISTSSTCATRSHYFPSVTLVSGTRQAGF